MARRILCVAEKPSIAKAVAQHLAGHEVRAAPSPPGLKYNHNYKFNFTFPPPWGNCEVTMTSVTGHLKECDFADQYRQWHSCAPERLFDVPLKKTVYEEKRPIEDNIKTQARNCQTLFIWTDCDREGEHIGAEIREVAQSVNRTIEVKRATFSNTERMHVIRAAKRPVDLDERQVNAVDTRIELDLRIGSALTRFTSKLLQSLGPPLARDGPNDENKVISYGPCQFPTLGFIVERYFRVRKFKPETFWGIKVAQLRENVNVEFSWSRHRLFDRAAVIILLEKCLSARLATVTKVQTKPTTKYRPFPLTTVELQKIASRYLRMTAKQTLDIAEKLYQKGWISYPRTETDQFDKAIDLRKLVEKQQQDPQWGNHARTLLQDQFQQPRLGRNNDKAHPPIHPVNYVSASALDYDQKRVYELITRRFLACCSADAKGETSIVEIEYGPENFSAQGLTVLERNFLDVYPYEKWNSSQPLPKFRLHENFVPTEANITEGKTTAPGYMTEPELIALMDVNGIGTDATMAEHITKIQDRLYVISTSSGGSTQPSETRSINQRGRGGRGGRSGAHASSRSQSNASINASTGVLTFIPTNLGVALIKGYDDIGLETSLSKPFMRKDTELNMKAICEGSKTSREVLQETIEQYRGAYAMAVRHKDKLLAAARKYVIQQDMSS